MSKIIANAYENRLIIEQAGEMTEEQVKDVERQYSFKPNVHTFMNALGKLFPNKTHTITTNTGSFMVSYTVEIE